LRRTSCCWAALQWRTSFRTVCPKPLRSCAMPASRSSHSADCVYVHAVDLGLDGR
jgi:hypothetical protein